MGAHIFPDPRKPRLLEAAAESTSSLSLRALLERPASQVCLLIDSCGRRLYLDAFKSHLENIFPLLSITFHISQQSNTKT